MLITLLRLAVISIWATAANGQAAEETKAKVPIVASQIRITATQLQNPPEIPANFRIPFSVINGSTSSLVLSDFRARFLIPSGAFVEAHELKSDAGLGSAYCPSSQSSIPPGAEKIILCEFQSTVELKHAFDLGALASNWSTLTFKPGKYQIHAIAIVTKLNEDGENEGDYITSSIVEVDLRPSIWQVVLGVLLGAFLLAAFRVISGRHPALTSDYPVILVKIAQGLGLTFSGWIAGSMLVFMTFRMSDVGFPIAITVSDFYGGIVVGLLSYLSALWLLDKLLPTPAVAGIAKDPEPSGKVDKTADVPLHPEIKNEVPKGPDTLAPGKVNSAIEGDIPKDQEKPAPTNDPP